MTEIRVDDSELPDGVDNRGWVGDGFDLAKARRPRLQALAAAPPGAV